MDVDIVLAETESALHSAVASKESDHRLMRSEMAEAMRTASRREIGIDTGKARYVTGLQVELPSFIGE